MASRLSQILINQRVMLETAGIELRLGQIENQLNAKIVPFKPKVAS